MTISKTTVTHSDPHEEAHHGPGHEGAHPHQGHQGHPGAAELGLNAASGTIKSISGTTFVLATEHGDLTVTTTASTNFHGLSRRRAREAGYPDPTVVNTFAGLKVGQRVGVMGECPNDTMLVAKRVHVANP
jgi:hypothetical protein